MRGASNLNNSYATRLTCGRLLESYGRPPNGSLLKSSSTKDDPVIESWRYLDVGAISAEMESITSALPGAMSLLRVPLGASDSSAYIALASWRQSSVSAISRLRSVTHRVALVLSLNLFGVGLLRMRTLVYWRFEFDSIDSKEGDHVLTQHTRQRM